MKKFFSILFIFILLFSLFGSVYAEEGLTTYNWSDVSGIIQESFSDDSSYFLIEDVDAVIWLPSYFSSVDLTDEDIENGGVGSFVNVNGNALVYLSYSDMEGFSLDSLFSYYTLNNYNAEIVLINDIPAILMRDEANDILSLSYQTQAGKLFQILFYPMMDQSYAALYQLVISSIRPYSPLLEEPSEPAVSTNPVSGLISK